MSKRAVISSAIVLLGLLLIYTQFTIFVVPPIGAVPKGMTLIFPRLNKTNFIDSPDAMCARELGGVSLMCRGMTLGAVAKNTTIIARFPYSATLYQISTDGKTYGS